MNKFLLVWSLFCVILLENVFAQVNYGLPPIYTFSYKDYSAHMQNWGGIISKSGILYVANGDGLMVFDGYHWKLYTLPNNVVPRGLTYDNKGNLWIYGNNIIAKVICDSLGNINFKVFTQNVNIVWDLFVKDSLFYIRSDTSFSVFKISDFQKPIFSVKKLFFSLAKDKQDYFYLNTQGDSVYIINDLKIVNKFKNPELIFGLFEKDDQVWALGYKNLYKINYLEGFSLIKPHFLDLGRTLISGIIYNNHYIHVTTNNRGYFCIDTNGRVIYNINDTSGLISNIVFNVLPDNIGNVWLFGNGAIYYVDLKSPYKIIDKRFHPKATNPNGYALIDSVVYCEGDFNLLKLDLSNKIEITNPGKLTGQFWQFRKIGKFIFIAYNGDIIRLDSMGNYKRYGLGKNIWDIVQIPYQRNFYLVGTNQGMLLYEFNGEDLIFVKQVNGFNKRARQMIFDRFNNLWIANSTDGIYKIRLNKNFDVDKISYFSKNNGLTSLNSLHIFLWFNKLFISTYKTLFYYDYLSDSIKEFMPVVSLFERTPKTIIQLVDIDKYKNLWIEYHDENDQISVRCVSYINGKFVEKYRSARRIINYGLVGGVNYRKYFITFFSEFFTLYNYSTDTSYFKMNYRPIVSKVQIINTNEVVFGGFYHDKDNLLKDDANTKITLKYKNRNIRIFYAVPYFIENKNILYRYKLAGYDNDWSPWTTETKKDYTNLAPGEYIFYIEAKNIFDEVSTSQNFRIEILAPWYYSTFAKIIYLLLLIGLIYLIVLLYTYNLRKRNEKLEKIVEERTHELKMKNIELEQQKEEILTQAEELNILNQQLEKYATIIRETDNAVMLMDKEGNFVWVNPAFSRIFGYSLEELVSSNLNNIFSLTNNPEIEQKILQSLQQKEIIKFEMSIRNKFNQNIWLHVTLTPILDDENNITDLVAINADITALKEAEQLILEHQQILEANIAYASFIQKSALPHTEDINKYFKSYIIYLPKDFVSGDFYWISNVFSRKNEQIEIVDNASCFDVGQSIFFAVVDCTGHGVPGAFMTLIANNLLSIAINERKIFEPYQVLNFLDEYLSFVLKRVNKDSIDGMTTSLCRFDKFLDTNNEKKIFVTFAGSKQHITFYKFSERKFFRLRGSARQIAFTINPEIQFTQQNFILDIGDILLLYSDGLKDLNNFQRQSFGHTRIIDIIKQNLEKPIEQIGDILKEQALQWLGKADPRDDVVFVILQMI